MAHAQDRSNIDGNSRLKSLQPKGTSIIGRNQRSCDSCHQQKIRCNRARLCSQCARAGWACTYPSAKQDPRRNLTSLPEISGCLERVESMLSELLRRNTVEGRPVAKHGIKTMSGPAAELARLERYNQRLRLRWSTPSVTLRISHEI